MTMRITPVATERNLSSYDVDGASVVHERNPRVGDIVFCETCQDLGCAHAQAVEARVLQAQREP